MNQAINEQQVTLNSSSKKEIMRKDKYSVPIVKGERRHHITFKDQFDKKQELTFIITVDNWKEFNINTCEEEKSQTSCSCGVY